MNILTLTVVFSLSVLAQQLNAQSESAKVLPIAKYRYNQDGTQGIVWGSRILGIASAAAFTTTIKDFVKELLIKKGITTGLEMGLKDLNAEEPPEYVVICFAYAGYPPSTVNNEDVIFLLEYSEEIPLGYPLIVSYNELKIEENLNILPPKVGIPISFSKDRSLYNETEYMTAKEAGDKIGPGVLKEDFNLQTMGVVDSYIELAGETYLILKQYTPFSFIFGESVGMKFVPVRVTNRGQYPSIGSVILLEGIVEGVLPDGQIIYQDYKAWYSERAIQAVTPFSLVVLNGVENSTYTVNHELFTLHYEPNFGELVSIQWVPVSPKIESIADIVLIIDRSGSMAGEKLELAKSAAKFLINLVEDNVQIAVVNFDDEAETDAILTLIRNESSRDHLKQTINWIADRGGTNLGAGLEQGYYELVASQSTDSPKAAIFLTDGDGDYNDQAKLYADKGWTIYTIGLGSDVRTDRLIEIAKTTPGGEYFAASVNNIQTIYNKILTRIAGGSTIFSYDGYINPFQEILLPIINLWESITELIISGNLQGSKITLIVTDPNGKEYGPSSQEQDVTYQESETFSFYKIKNPIPGQWRVKVIGTEIPVGGEPFNVSVTTRSSISSNMFAFEPSYNPGDIINVGVNLKEKSSTNQLMPISNAKITATIIRPDGIADTLELFDDGNHGDNLSNDGNYANQYTAADKIGQYLVKVGSGDDRIPEVQETVYVGNIDQISIDGSSLNPSPGTIVDNYRPTIQVLIRGNGNNIDASSIELSLDDNLVPSVYDRVNQTVSYTPKTDLSVGTHRLVLKARDLSGNKIPLVEWEFSVKRKGDLITIISSGPDDSPSPVFKNNLQRTGQSEYPGPLYPKLSWSMVGVSSPPSISSNGTLYAMSADSNLYAMSRNGTLLWKLKIEYGSFYSPLIGNDGTIYIGSGNGQLHAISPDGNVLWNYETATINSNLYPTIGNDGTIYVGSSDRHLYAISPSGTLLWEIETDGSVADSPSISKDGIIYVITFRNILHAISPDGSLLWKFKPSEDSFTHTSPAIGSDGTIYLLADKYLYAVSTSGILLWKIETPDYYYIFPSIGRDGTIYIGSTAIYAIASDGTLQWKFDADGSYRFSSPTIGADGIVYAGSSDGYLYAFSPNGTLIWKFRIGVGIYLSPVIDTNGMIYLYTEYYNLYALSETPSSLNLTSKNGENQVYANFPILLNVSLQGDFDPKLEYYTNLMLSSTSAKGVFSLTATFDSTITSVEIIKNKKSFLIYYKDESAGKVTINASTSGFQDAILDLEILALSTLAQSPHPMFRHDPQHTGRSEYSGPIYPKLKWKFKTEGELWSSPSIGVDGTIYVTSDDHHLYAISADGELKWKLIVSEGTRPSSPTISSDGTIYVVSDKLHAVSPSGTLLWTYGWLNGGAPIIGSNGIIYVNFGDGLTALLPNGNVLWKKDLNGSVFNQPAISHDGTIYTVSSDNNRLIAVSPNGDVEWSINIKDIITSPSIGDDGIIYVPSGYSFTTPALNAISPDGVLLWSNALSWAGWDWTFNSPSIGYDKIIYIGATDEILHAVSNNGRRLWNLLLSSEEALWYMSDVSSPIIDKNGIFYVVSSNGLIAAIPPISDPGLNLGPYDINDAATAGLIWRDILWTFQLGKEVYSYPIIGSDGTIYVGSTDGFLYAIGEAPLSLYLGSKLGRAYTNSPIELTITLRDDSGNNEIKFTEKTEINLISSTTSGQFSLTPTFDSTITSEIIDIGNLGKVYYRDSELGKVTLTASSTEGKEAKLELDMVAPIILAESPYPMSMLNPQHTNRSEYFGPIYPKLKWKFETGNSIYSSPTIASDGTIYIGSSDNYIYAISSTGGMKWKLSIEDPLTPTISSDGTIYVGSTRGLYAISPDGIIKWEFKGYKVSSPNISNEGILYASGRVLDGEEWKASLFSISPNGALLWEYIGNEEEYFSSPSIDNEGAIYVGSSDNYIYAFSPDGALRWKFKTDNEVWSSPSIGADGVIYFSSDDSNVYAVYPNGVLRWKFKVEEYLASYYAAPSIGSDGTLFISIIRPGHIYAIHQDGTLKWKLNLGVDVFSITLDGDGVVYAGTEVGVYAISPDGQVIWNSQISVPEYLGDVYRAPVIDSNRTIYVGSRHNLFAIEDTPVTLNISSKEKKIYTNKIIEFTVSLADDLNQPVEANQTLNIDLSSSSNLGLFSLSTTFDSTLTSITISRDTSSVRVYYKDISIGKIVLTALGYIQRNMQEKQLELEISPLFTNLTSESNSVYMGNYFSITISLEDSSGKQITTDLPANINLFSTSTVGHFSITTVFDSTITSVTIPAGESSAKVYYKDKNVGKVKITAYDALQLGVGESFIELEVLPLVATLASNTSFSYTGIPMSLTISLSDSVGRRRTIDQVTTISLVSTSEKGQLSLTTDFDSTITSISIPAKTSSVQFYYRDTELGKSVITTSGPTIKNTTLEVEIKAPTLSINHDLIKPIKPGDSVLIRANVTGDPESKNLTVFYRNPEEKDFRKISMTKKIASQWEISLPSEISRSTGIQYYIKALTDYPTIIATSPDISSKQKMYGIAIEGLNLSDNTIISPATYKIISMPLKLDIVNPVSLLQTSLGEQAIATWRLFGYDISTGSYIENQTLKHGNGYWLFSKESKPVAIRGTTANPAQNFGISLSKGWNLIGNPFAFDAYWGNALIKVRGEEINFNSTEENQYVRQRYWWYNDVTSDYINNGIFENKSSPFDETHILQPWLGYAVYALEDCELLISPSQDVPAPAAKPLAQMPPLWQVRLTAKSGSTVDSGNYFGVSQNAVEGYDTEDIEKPPFPSDEVSLSFPHFDWGRDSNNYSLDCKEPFEDEKSWHVTVTSANKGKSVNLTWDNIETIPEHFNSYLMDKFSGAVVDMRQDKGYSYSLNLDRDIRDFEILVTSKKMEARGAIPSVSSLIQNYPNPFNPETLIPFHLSEGSPVVIKIYNISGQLIRTLDLGFKQAGYYDTRSRAAYWDGRDEYGEMVSSGIYFYQIKAGSYSAVKKMVLIR